MQREFDRVEESFRQQVAEFFAHIGPREQRLASAAGGDIEAAAWRKAVVARGWSVPDWPVSAGGTGWSATQKFIWQQACAVHGIDAALDPGVTIVGPLLLREAGQAQRRAFLAGIRDLAERWCIGFAEAEAGAELARLSTSARLEHGVYRINGAKTWVSEAMDADWMCCLARFDGGESFALFAVDMHSEGLHIKPVRTFDGAATMAEVTLRDVRVPADHMLAGPGDGRTYAQLFTTNVYSTLSKSAVARAQLEALDASLAAFDPVDGMHARRDALAVELAALEALELRFLDALSQSAEPPFSLSLLRLRSRDILLQLGALQVECFGYYALPYPDELLLHNEGPVGPSAAPAVIRSTLAQQVAALYEGSAELLKDEMARQLEIDD